MESKAKEMTVHWWVFLWCYQDFSPVCRSGLHHSDIALARVQEGMAKMIKSVERLPNMRWLTMQGLSSLKKI